MKVGFTGNRHGMTIHQKEVPLQYNSWNVLGTYL